MLFKVLYIEGLLQMEYQQEQYNRLHKPSRTKQNKTKLKLILAVCYWLSVNWFFNTLIKKQIGPHRDLHQSSYACQNSQFFSWQPLISPLLFCLF